MGLESQVNIELVKKAQSGDKDALGQLYADYKDSVYFTARKLVKRHDVAEDILQETMIQMYKSIGSLRNPEAFNKWLTSICYKVCYKHFRKEPKIHVSINDEESFVDEIMDDDENTIPDEIVDRKDFQRTINRMIDELSDTQRAATLMYYYELLSVSDIAEIMGCPQGTVKSYLNYARKNIKKSVEEYEKKHNKRVIPGFQNTVMKV